VSFSDGLDFEDLLIRPQPSQINSRADVQLRIPVPKLGERLPIIASNMHGIGNLQVARILEERGWLTALEKKFSNTEGVVGAIRTYGLNDNRILDSEPQKGWIILDVANGYMDSFVQYAAAVRKKHPDAFIVAGNVATAVGADNLWNAGVDAVKVGIGSGGVCTTRIQAGVGVPQASAVLVVAELRDSYYPLKYVVSDGGCRTPGDVAKAFACGANFVMLGSMLSGYDETGTEFCGSASRAAMVENNIVGEYRYPEGREVKYQHSKGPLANRLLEIEAGLRSACSYVGAESIGLLGSTSKFPLQVVRRQYNRIRGDY